MLFPGILAIHIPSSSRNGSKLLGMTKNQMAEKEEKRERIDKLERDVSENPRIAGKMVFSRA